MKYVYIAKHFLTFDWWMEKRIASEWTNVTKRKKWFALFSPDIYFFCQKIFLTHFPVFDICYHYISCYPFQSTFPMFNSQSCTLSVVSFFSFRLFLAIHVLFVVAKRLTLYHLPNDVWLSSVDALVFSLSISFFSVMNEWSEIAWV